MPNPIPKLWNSVVGWFNEPAIDGEVPCARCPLTVKNTFTVGDVASMSEVRRVIEASAARRTSPASLTREEVEALIAASEKRMRDLIARSERYGKGSPSSF